MTSASACAMAPAMAAGAVAPACPAERRSTGMPAFTASSITWQDSVAKRKGGTTKQLLLETNGRSRHLSSPPAMSCSIDTAGELAGKRMATLDYQKDAIHMVNFVKATVVPSDITNFAGKFNNGSVDTAYAPAFAYEALELYKGIGESGGVVDYPLAQLTLQMVARDDVLDDETAQKAREEKWVRIPEKDIRGYQEMFRENRIEMRDGLNGAPDVYHPKMMGLLSKIRCASNPAAAECTAANRE